MKIKIIGKILHEIQTVKVLMVFVGGIDGRQHIDLSRRPLTICSFL